MQQEIQDTVATMLGAIDRLDWDVVRAAFAPMVAVDYTSLFGGSAEILPVETLIGRWQGLLPGFEATQHLIGPVLVTGDGGPAASAGTPVRGYHYLSDAEGGPVWMAAGRYRLAMERHAGAWRIAGLTLDLAYQEGNRGLPEVAQARVAAGKGRRPSR